MPNAKREATAVLAQYNLTLDGPHVTALGWEGTIDAPDGMSFGGQTRCIAVAGLDADEFWSDVIEMAQCDGPELCADDCDVI